MGIYGKFYAVLSMSFERTTISWPIGLRDRAKNAGINISGYTAKSVLHLVEISEKETGVNASKQSPPAAATCEGRSS
jgi:hypothetical protein